MFWIWEPNSMYVSCMEDSVYGLTSYGAWLNYNLNPPKFQIRSMYNINGNAIEDFFACLFMYSPAIVQMDVTTADLEPDTHSNIFKSKKKKNKNKNKKNELPLQDSKDKDPEAGRPEGESDDKSDAEDTAKGAENVAYEKE